jgi:hypothetical protein
MRSIGVTIDLHNFQKETSMRLKASVAIFSFCIGIVAPLTAGAWDTSLDTIYWRTSCVGFDPEACFKSPQQTGTLMTWLILNRPPSAANPLIIDIGPGTFLPFTPGYYEVFACVGGWSHLTLRGSGPGVTIIGDESLAGLQYPLSGQDCHNLHVQDLTLASPDKGMWWNGPGSSTWQNVEIIGQNVGWYDFGCTPGDQAVHYFFNSRIRTNGAGGTSHAVGMNVCSENWLYGSEISALGNANSDPGLTNLTAINILEKGGSDPGDVRVFGSAIRAGSGELTPGQTAFMGATGVEVTDGGTFHSHGSIINATTTGIPGSNATGISASGAGSFAHTPETAFNISPGSSGGVGTRIVEQSGGKILSPYLWQSGVTPPGSTTEANAIISLDGQDMFVETDCDVNGNCENAGIETHLMIYNEAACPETKWFDVVTNACRTLGSTTTPTPTATPLPTPSPTPAAEICDDGIDNDGDNKIDCADKPDCRQHPAC